MQILGLGTATPAGILEQTDAARFAHPYNCQTTRQQRVLDRLYAQTGITRRNTTIAASAAAIAPSDNPMADWFPLPGNGHGNDGPGIAHRMLRYQKVALPLAETACRDALAAAQIEPGEVAQVVVVSCTGLAAPGVDLRLIDTLPLRPTVGRTMIGFMGCHGALNGLRVARGLAAASPGSVVLLCCVELCSLHFRYGWDRDRIVANALFADGAAAIVGRVGGADNPDAEELQLLASGSTVLPGSAEAMTWIIGDHGFEMTLSPRVPDLIHAHLRPWLQRFLADHGLGLEDVGSFAVHPGGPRVLDAVQSALDLPSDALDDSRAVLDQHGNMSSPTVLFILDRLRQRGAPGPIVTLAFGPGLTAEGCIVVRTKRDHQPSREPAGEAS